MHITWNIMWNANHPTHVSSDSTDLLITGKRAKTFLEGQDFHIFSCFLMLNFIIKFRAISIYYKINRRQLTWSLTRLLTTLIGRTSHLTTTTTTLFSPGWFNVVLYTTVILPSHARFIGVLILSDSLLFFAQALYASYLCFVTAIPVYFDSHRQYTGIFLRTFLWLCLMRMILIQLW